MSLEKKKVEHSEEVKKLRRKIEEKLRREIDEEGIKKLAEELNIK